MSLEQQLTESSQSTLLLTKSVDLLAAILGDLMGSIDKQNELMTAMLAASANLGSAQAAQTAAAAAAVKQAAESKVNKTTDTTKVQVSEQVTVKVTKAEPETKANPFEKEDFTKRMGEIVALVGDKGDGRAIAQAVLGITGSDKVGVTMELSPELQADAINNLDSALAILKTDDDKTVEMNMKVFNVMVDADTKFMKPEQPDETTSTTDAGDDDFGPEDDGKQDQGDYYDDDTKVELTVVQLAMRQHAGAHGKESAIAILKAGGSITGAAKDLPEARRKSVVDMLMKNC